MNKWILWAAVLASTPSFAASTAGDLYAACISGPDTRGEVICQSYINGFAEGLIGDQLAREQGTPICLPNDISTAELRRVIQSWIAMHPDLLLPQASLSVVTAVLVQVYPCKK